MSSEPGSDRAGPVTRRELWLAALCFLLLFAWPLREGLLRGDRVLIAVDTATVQLPWSATESARNPELSDQGVVFYPAYRFVIAGWLEGGPPLWNPYLHAGAPAVGNPQLGVLDPQVGVLALLEAVGGQALADRAFAFLAWSRLVGAGLGAYLLARHLGLGPAAAALTGVSFGGSGFLVLWLNASLGHVAPFLPWILLALEHVRGTRPLRALGSAALLLGLAILGGHPETAFFVGVTAGLWSLSILRQSRRAGWRCLAALALGTLLASASLLPFVEYLRLSGARVAREALASTWPEPLHIGLFLLAFGLVAGWRRAQLTEQGLSPRALLPLLAAGLGLGCVVFASGSLPALALLPDLGGAPGSSPGSWAWGWPGSFIERVSPWLAAPALGLALAGALLPSCEFPRRAWVLALGLGAWLLAVDQPVALGLFRQLPGIGLAETGRCAVVSALMLSLLAGAALERAPRAARLAAGLVLLVQAGALLVPSVQADLVRAPELGPLQTELPIDPPDEVVGYSTRPPAELRVGERVQLAGSVHPGVAAANVRVFAELPGRQLERAVDVTRGGEGQLEFRLQPWRADATELGTWSLRVEILDDAGELLGTRIAAATRITAALHPRPLTLAFALLSLAALCLLPPRRRGWIPCVFVALAAVQVLDFAAGKNPAVPVAEVFPETQTERILARELGTRRYFSDAGVLPPDTGMVRGLRSLGGYDGLDVASFNLLRYAALTPGAQPILDWNPRGVGLDSAAFRLFGVGLLVLAGPLEHPDWELLAAPLGTPAPELAETFLYRARDPLPQAFCVARTLTLDEVVDDPAAFDPSTTAFLDPGTTWTPARALTTSTVQTLDWTNDRIALNASLDGDGLLVLTEQHFPGWHVTVDGQPANLLRTNGIFRGVALTAGSHLVVFEYRPLSFTLGLALSLLAAVLCLSLLLLGSRRLR